LSRAVVEERVVEVHDGEHEIFVKEVQNHLADSDVINSSMEEKKSVKEFKLAKRIVT
jgi:hypothetical protein